MIRAWAALESIGRTINHNHGAQKGICAARLSRILARIA